MKSKFWKNTFKYILEASIVAFGVVLGLYLSERNAKNKTDQNTKETLTYIVEELKANKTELENALEYHKSLSVEFDSIARSMQPSDFEEIYYKSKKFRHFWLPGWKGVGTAKIKTVVYESAKLSGVLQEINIKTIQQIAGTYQWLEDYQKISRIAEDQLLQIDADTKVADVLRVFELLKYDISTYEKSLSGTLKIAAKELEDSIEKGNYKK